MQTGWNLIQRLRVLSRIHYVKDDLILFNYCKAIYQKNFDEILKNIFANTYKLWNHDINKFIWLLQKCVCPYEYMNDWEKLNETLLLEKDDFYSYLNMDDIIDADYTPVKKKHLFFVQSDTLLLADVFNNF